MTDILASGISAITKYDNRTENVEKVLPRLDMRLLAVNLQYLLETTRGYSFSGNEGYSQAQNTLSTITASNYLDYQKSLLQTISTLVSHRNYLDVDPASTANGITLIKSKITTENAPNGENYARENELPFKFKNNLTFTFKAKDTNTGPVSLSIPALEGFTGSIPLVNQDLTSLSQNDIIQNYIYEITADATNSRFILTPHLRKATNLIQGVSFINKPITISNNTTDADNDIDFTAGNFVFSDGSGQAVVSALTKRLDASWTAGNNQGGLDTGTKASHTWYHCYAIHNLTSGVSDSIFSANATNPTLPSGYTKYKYLGSVATNISGNIVPFIQKENYFEWKDAFLDQVGTLAGTIIHPISVPPVIVLANISMTGGGGSGETNAQVGIFGNNATPNSAVDFVVAFFTGEWDGPGSATKLVLSTNQTIKSKTFYGRGSNSSYGLSTFGYYNLSL